MGIVREANQRRRAHRVDLPMVLELEGRAFEVLDWSVTGLAARLPPDMDLPAGRELPARIHIPLPGGRLALDVRLRVVGRRDDERVAFAFVDLSPRHRRILRHYIELGIEGKITEVEDLVSILAQPDVPTPIRDALGLEDLDDAVLAQSFRRRALVSVTVGVAFVLFVAIVLFYNTTYRVAGDGVALAALRRVPAAVTAPLVRLEVRPGQTVRRGDPLFALDDRELQLELERVEEEIALLRLGAPALAASVPSGQDGPAVRLAAGDASERPTGLFPVPILAGRPSRVGRDALAAVEPSPAFLERRRELVRLFAARERLELERARRVGRAPVNGRVLRVTAEPGDRVAAGRTVVVLEEDGPPVIVARVRSYEARRLRPGMEAWVSSAAAPTFRARIVALGHGSVDPDFPLTQEVGLDQVPVVLQPEDPTVRLPPFAHVEVWIRTFRPFGA